MQLFFLFFFYDPSHIQFTGSVNVPQMSPIIYSLKYIHLMPFVVNLLNASASLKPLKQ
jgi:hypothetical protein